MTPLLAEGNPDDLRRRIYLEEEEYSAIRNLLYATRKDWIRVAKSVVAVYESEVEETRTQMRQLMQLQRKSESNFIA